MKLNIRTIFLLVSFVIIHTLFSFQTTEASSTSVEFIVDFSENMKEMIGNKSKIEIAREIVSSILDNIHEPLDAGLTFYGHRSIDKCDDIELVVPIQGLDRQTMKRKLLETEPKGKAPIASALTSAAERLKENKIYRSIILITDGKMTCKEDLIKTAREIKERYDYNVTFHVIGLNPKKGDRLQLVRTAYAGYGIYRNIENKDGIDETVKLISEKLNNPLIHTPKIITSENMVLIPAGEFFMGSNNPEAGPSEHPKHLVYLDSFYIDRFEVTQKQFKEVMGYNPSMWIGSDLPVDSVSWFEAKEYCEKVGKRLPTEAEWEKAAKGGRDDIWPGTNIKENIGEYAWIDDMIVPIGSRSGSRTHPVGQKKPNGYGIYDMAGNVHEWVYGWLDLDYYKKSLRVNPKGPQSGIFCVLRGGCWDNHWIEVRTTSRYGKVPETKYSNNGFRCAKSVE